MRLRQPGNPEAASPWPGRAAATAVPRGCNNQATRLQFAGRLSQADLEHIRELTAINPVVENRN